MVWTDIPQKEEKLTTKRSLTELMTFELECAVPHIEGKSDEHTNLYWKTKAVTI